MQLLGWTRWAFIAQWKSVSLVNWRSWVRSSMHVNIYFISITIYRYGNLLLRPYRSKEAIYILCWRFDSDSKWTSWIQRTTRYIKCVSILIYLLVLWIYEKNKRLDHLKNQVDEFISRLYYPQTHYVLVPVFKVLNNLFLSTRIQCLNH